MLETLSIECDVDDDIELNETIIFGFKIPFLGETIRKCLRNSLHQRQICDNDYSRAELLLTKMPRNAHSHSDEKDRTHTHPKKSFRILCVVMIFKANIWFKHLAIMVWDVSI